MEYLCDWARPDSVTQSSTLETQGLLKICRANLGAQEIWELNRLLGHDTLAAVREDEPFLKVPRLLGLEWFDGLSFESLYRDPEWSLTRIRGLQWIAMP